MNRKIKFSLIITILIFSLFFNFVSLQNKNIKAAEYTLTQSFSANSETYFEEISITSNPSVLHLRFEYLSANEPTMVMQVYNITAGNNTQMWSDSLPFYVLRLESNIDLNITVTSTDLSNYPADFRLKIFVNQIISITDQDDYLWVDDLYFSGDCNYLFLTYNEITTVNIHTILNESELDHLWIKARVYGTEDWIYSDDSIEDESFLSFQVMPGETMELYVETMGNPVLYPLEFTLTISISDKTTVNTKTAEYTNFLTEEETSHFYEISITEASTNMRLYCIPDYTLFCDIFNSTTNIHHTYVQNSSSHTGFNFTFEKTGDYLLELQWETPVESIKNNYTLRLVFGEIEITLIPNELYILDDNFFHPSDQPNYRINIPAGNYQFKLLELDTHRHEWSINFDEGYSDSWQNFYYTVVIIIPPFPIQQHNWKDLIYSKLVDQESSLILKLDKYNDIFDYNLGIIIEDYILSDDTEEIQLTNEFLNVDDYDYYRINVSDDKYLNLQLDTLEDSIDKVILEIFDVNFDSVGIWTLNDSFILDFEPVEPGIYYLKVSSEEEIGKYSITLKVLDVTKKGTGFNWIISILGIISLEIVCLVLIRRRKK